MAREKLVDEQPGMDGGLNDVSDDSALQPNQLRRATNLRLTDFGAATKRGGTQRTSTNALAAAAVLNGFTFQQDSGTNQILAVCNGALRTATYGAFPWTWASPSGALSTSVSPDFAQFRDASGADVVYIADGGLLNRWNGTALSTDLVNTVAVNTLQVHNERLWACGNSAFPDSVFYSDLNNGDTLGYGGGGGGQIVVRTFGDEAIVGLASINTSLLIFHRRGISRITGFGQDDISAAPAGVTADVGTIAAKSIVASNNIGYFISERGLYRCNESEVSPVGTPVKPDPILPIIRQLSSSQFDKIRCLINRATKELWISIPGYGCYQYHTVLDSWSGPWDGGYIDPDTTALFEAINSSGLPVVLKGDASGWVTLCDAPAVFVDNMAAAGTGGARYSMTAQLHRMYCGDDAESKAFRWGYLTAQLKGSDQCRVEWNSGDSFGSFSLKPSTDETWGAVSTYWGTGTWGGTGSQSYRISMGGTGYYVDISIIDSGEALPVFSRFKLETFALGRR
jgi:hypothetical protein